MKVINDDILENINEDDPDFPPVARLIELGRKKTYVTIDDILNFFPEAERDVDQLEEAFAALLSAGIPYVDDDTTIEPTDEERKRVPQFFQAYWFGEGSLLFTIGLLDRLRRRINKKIDDLNNGEV